MTEDNKKRLISVIILVFILAAFAALYFYAKSRGLIDIFSSSEALQDYIKSYGALGPLIFGLLQVVQVVISPIPGNITTLAGGVMFGFWPALLISSSSILIGSLICFGLARAFGKPLVVRMVGTKITEKYLNVFSTRQRIVLIFMFLFPFFPDDALCLIAGISGMSWGFFIVAILLTRPLGLIVAALIGSGAISMPIWGWAVIVGITVVLFALSIKYADKIQAFASHIMDKLRKHGKAE